jgi:hypothetical protein
MLFESMLVFTFTEYNVLLFARPPLIKCTLNL